MRIEAAGAVKVLQLRDVTAKTDLSDVTLSLHQISFVVIDNLVFFPPEQTKKAIAVFKRASKADLAAGLVLDEAYSFRQWP